MSSRKTGNTLALQSSKTRGSSATESASARGGADVSPEKVTVDPAAVSEKTALALNGNARQPTIADRQAALEVAKRIMRENEDVLAALAK